MNLIAQCRDQRVIYLSMLVLPLSCRLSMVVLDNVHFVQDNAPRAIGRLEALDFPTLKAFTDRLDGQAEALGGRAQVNVVLLVVLPVVQHRPAPCPALSDAPQ